MKHQKLNTFSKTNSSFKLERTQLISSIVQSIKKREVKTLENQDSKGSSKNFPLSTSSFGAFFDQKSQTPRRRRSKFSPKQAESKEKDILSYIKIENSENFKKKIIQKSSSSAIDEESSDSDSDTGSPNSKAFQEKLVSSKVLKYEIIDKDESPMKKISKFGSRKKSSKPKAKFQKKGISTLKKYLEKDRKQEEGRLKLRVSILSSKYIKSSQIRLKQL